MNFLTKDIMSLTDSELKELVDIVYSEETRRAEIKHHSDLKKRMGKRHIRVKLDRKLLDGDTCYSFFLVKSGEELDFYYGVSERLRGSLRGLIPHGFSECKENCYEFRGNEVEARIVLAKCGITDIVNVAHE